MPRRPSDARSLQREHRACRAASTWSIDLDRRSEVFAVDAGAIGHRNELVGRSARMATAAAAQEHAELVLNRLKTALERSEHARGDSARMPVHSHDGAERLKPKWVSEPPEQLVAPIVMNDGFRDHAAEPRHAQREPARHSPAVKWKIGKS